MTMVVLPVKTAACSAGRLRSSEVEKAGRLVQLRSPAIAGAPVLDREWERAATLGEEAVRRIAVSVAEAHFGSDVPMFGLRGSRQWKAVDVSAREVDAEAVEFPCRPQIGRVNDLGACGVAAGESGPAENQQISVLCRRLVTLGRMRSVPLTLFVFLLTVALWPATAMAVDGDGETTFEVPLKGNHGLTVKLEADDDEIELIVRKGSQYAVYSAPWEVSPAGIAVKFGPFGEFDVDYQLFRTLETHEPGRRCTGEPRTKTEGFFRGVIRFRGEGGYVEVEASRVKGTLILQPQWDCNYHRPGVTSPTVARKVDDEEATLTAHSRRTGTSFGAIGARSLWGNFFRNPRGWALLAVLGAGAFAGNWVYNKFTGR